MGAKQSTFEVAPQHFHAPKKNKTFLSLEKSRASYLSEHLTACSETNLDTIGTDATTKGQVLRHKLRLGITKPPPGAITKQPPVTVTKSKAVPNDAQHEVMLAEEEDSNLEDSVEPEMVVVMRNPQQNSQKPPVVLTDVIKNDGVKKGRRTFKPLGRYDRSSSFHDAVDHQASKVRPEDFHFAFHNLVFEGGGNKGLAYCGAVRHYCLGETRDAEDLPEFEDWWIPVHLKDMAELTTKHPDVSRKCRESHFTVQKTQRVFSSIPIDQAHEQNNGCIKGDGGAVGLTDNPSALRRWIVAGPEVARRRWIPEFEEECQDVVKLDTKEIAGPAVVETVMDAKRIGQEQFEAFTRECLLDRTKAVDDPIPRNKLKVFSISTPRSQSKGQ
ncbi:uncharacterized protein [Littorina saxatilis]|uniref:uncharacterized protein n=1 Tax=Littorina saxatilis TaxID=31220 RepID=UPI0038B42A23